MRDRRFLSAVRRDKEMFAKKSRARQDVAETARLMELIGQKRIVYRPGIGAMFRVQLRYMSAWQYGVHIVGLLATLCLGAYARRQQALTAQEVFALAAVWMILATACVVGGMELAAANHMGELAATCYLSLGQLVCVRLILGAAGQLAALAAFFVLLKDCEGAYGIYLTVVWMAANAVYFFIFGTVRGRGQFPALLAAAMLLSVVVCFLSVVTGALFLLSAGACLVLLLLCALVVAGELAYVFAGIKKGEILCFD